MKKFFKYLFIFNIQKIVELYFYKNFTFNAKRKLFQKKGEFIFNAIICHCPYIRIISSF